MFTQSIFHKKTWPIVLLTVYTAADSCVGCYQNKACPRSSAKNLTTQTNAKEAMANAYTTNTADGCVDPDQNKACSGSSAKNPTTQATPKQVMANAYTTNIADGCVDPDQKEVCPGPSAKNLTTHENFTQPMPSLHTNSEDNPPGKSNGPFANLSNIGNTCWLNVFLQIIAAIYANEAKEVDWLKDIIDQINTPTSSKLTNEDMDKFANAASLPEEIKKMVMAKKASEVGDLFDVFEDLKIILHPIKVNGADYSYKLPVDLVEGNQEIPNMSKEINDAIGRYYGQSTVVLPDKLAIEVSRADNSSKDKKLVDQTMCMTIQSDFNQDNTFVFDLQGFIAHCILPGGSNHYVAYVKRKERWWLADDLKPEVAEVGLPEMERASKTAEMLFYVKR